MTAKRLFVAIDPSAGIKRLLVELDPAMPGMRWARSQQMHLTLGFFPHVAAPAEEKLRAHLSAIKFGSFVLPVQELGAFLAKGSPKVIWVGLGTGHPHLFQIHQRVQEAAIAAGLEPDLRPWHPHITLARCRGLSPQAARQFLTTNAEADAGMFRVENFSLYSSQLTSAGSIYTQELSVHCRQGDWPSRS